jgi:hypothetical protein
LKGPRAGNSTAWNGCSAVHLLAGLFAAGLALLLILLVILLMLLARFLSAALLLLARTGLTRILILLVLVGHSDLLVSTQGQRRHGPEVSEIPQVP